MWETIPPKTATVEAPAPVIKLPQPPEVKALRSAASSLRLL